MSSNLRVQKVCEECRRDFIARTTVTRCCSDRCAKRHYKRRRKQEWLDNKAQEKRKIEVDILVNQTYKGQQQGAIAMNSTTVPIIKELLSLSEIAFVLGISKRTFQRMLASSNIPRIHLGKRILFRKEEVLDYLHQIQNNERKTSRKAT